ncbi:hypothetical protein JTB14_018672 [Gonioctena quinquepunctata]|nr:hypothetical protein JTB14_018672 [Gonioctena quinquepunctata]
MDIPEMPKIGVRKIALEIEPVSLGEPLSVETEKVEQEIVEKDSKEDLLTQIFTECEFIRLSAERYGGNKLPSKRFEVQPYIRDWVALFRALCPILANIASSQISMLSGNSLYLPVHLPSHWTSSFSEAGEEVRSTRGSPSTTSV